MSLLFSELDYRPTPMGVLSLRKRRELTLGIDVYEIKLGDEFLMSSLFVEAEKELSRRAIAKLDPETADGFDIVVGGLGLGYTAKAALDAAGVSRLTIVEALPEVVEWHQESLLPLGKELCADERCRFVVDDFFRGVRENPAGLDPDRPQSRHHAILVDIDHSPDNFLSEAHRDFYTEAGLGDLKKHLLPGGLFALWSTACPNSDFEGCLRRVFTDVSSEIVSFRHPVFDREDTNTIYFAHNGRGG